MTEFRILGPLEVRRDAEELSLGGRNQRAVLALLLLRANGVVSIEQLAEELYGGATPVSAVTQVHRQVSELRRVLDPPQDGAERAPSMIETRPPGYVLQVHAGALDLHRFEELLERAAAAMREAQPEAALGALDEGLALWRGPALADLAYESFAQAPSARLEELRIAALEQRAEAQLALGRHVAAVPELRELAAAHPLRERLRELLMLALYRSGRQVEALDVYRVTRAELSDAFGVEPGLGLQHLEQAILRHDPGLGAPGADSGWSATPGSVVVAARDTARLAALLAVAEPLAHRPVRELIVAALVDDEAGLDEATAALAGVRPRLAQPARTAAFVASRRSDDVLHLAHVHEADLVLFEADAGTDGALTAEVTEIFERSSADAGLVFAPPAPPEPGGGVLVPFGGGEHDWAAVELGAWLAAATGERLRLAGTRADPHHGGRDASRLLADASLAVQRLTGVVAEPALVDAGSDSLVAAAATARVVVVGLSARWREDGLGATRAALTRDPPSPVVVVHRGLRPSGIAPRESATRFTWTIAG